MPRHFICTVGTSLLTNRDDQRPFGGWRPPEELPDPEIVDKWLQNADLQLASAETNTLRLLDVDESDSIAFLHSDTKEGLFCAERLQSFYENLCRNVTLHKVSKLGYGAHEFTGGLKSLVNEVIEEVNTAIKYSKLPIFCATGGFKAEIAFLNLLGALLGFEVVYIHEKHRELVILPRLPMNWNFDFCLNNRDFFDWIDSEPRPTSEVDSWLKSRPELRFLVEESDDGCTYLSAAGNLLFKAALQKGEMGPRPTWPPPAEDSNGAPLPPDKKNRVSGVGHHRPDGWERFVARLCEQPPVKSVRYDASARSSSSVRIIDPENGTIGVVYGSQGNDLPLVVETTAQGQGQTELFAQYIRKSLLKK